jgi:hypothetical protein
MKVEGSPAVLIRNEEDVPETRAGLRSKREPDR